MKTSGTVGNHGPVAGILAPILAALVVGIAFRTFFLFTARVPTASMAPTIQPGERILVDRLSYAFRKPQRGEIVVFEPPPGPHPLPHGQIYTKRLVGLGGETVSIGLDWRVRINGTQLESDSPGFERIYGTELGRPAPGIYHGHANQKLLDRTGDGKDLSPRIPTEKSSIRVDQEHLFLLGDNTLVSFDSRAWGELPRQCVIGRAMAGFGANTSSWRRLR